MASNRRLGVCYYPEHWPQSVWAEDARKMADIGLSQVRIGEFAWSRIEPRAGEFDWAWLDKAIETLGGAGLGVMLGTPTATPPKWLIDSHPDILAYDREGRPRKFGSRRHYCFSSERYRVESARIVEAVAERYGENDVVIAWQTDNEYGCHETVRSYSPAAARAFRLWLAEKYGDIADLNAAWGAVFWSQEYRSFDEVDLPNLTVTEPNPSQVLDFYRFSSDQVVSYNRLQTEIIRKYSPGRDIVHNFMGLFFDFDHFAVGGDLDAVGWDSYPLGFLDVAPFPEADKKRYMRQGHPDVAAFFHDLYRACGRGRWQVLEQQPGPVNWALHNPAPLPGMARFWALEAFAHDAEAVSYFRWRQAPFAQEQMHAGLEAPDGGPARAYEEARQAGADHQALSLRSRKTDTRAALVFSYDACWLFEAQPQGAGWSYPALCLEWYAALRRFGLNVDIVSPETAFDNYNLVLVPSLPSVSQSFLERMNASKAQFLFGPRSGSKTENLTIPDMMPPGPLQEVLPLKITRSESFPDFHQETGRYNGVDVSGRVWLDHVETTMSPLAQTTTGAGLYYSRDRIHYLTTVPDHPFLALVLMNLFASTNIEATLLPEDLRLRRNGDEIFAFNHGPAEIDLPEALGPADNLFIVGGRTLPPAGVSVWRAKI